MSRGWQVVVFVLLLAVSVHSRAQSETPSPAQSPGAVTVRQIQGSIADSQGRPVVGAEVWDLTSADPASSPREKKAVTGPAGQFSFQSSKAWPDLWICHPDYIPESLDLDTRTVSPVKVVLRPGGKISGRVVDSKGRPVAGARVRTNVRRHKPLPLGCSSGEPAPPCGSSAVSDSEGSFAVTSLASGWYDLGAFAEGYTPGWSGWLEARPGKKTAGGTIVLEPATRLAGRVLDSEGLPIPGAEISTSGECSPFTEQPVHSAEDGSYSLRCVAPGLQRVEIMHPEHSTIFTDVRLAPGDNSHDWTLRKRVEVRGRIVTSDGSPVEEAHIHSPRDRFAWTLAADPADGSFTGWVDAGSPIEIWASAEGGYADGKATLPASRPGDRIENIEIRLGRGARLTGKILGIPSPGTGVEIYAEPAAHDGRQPRSGKVDADGRYEIPGLLPGTWDVKARSGERTLTERVIVEPEEIEIGLDLTFPPVFEIRGRVVSMPDAKASLKDLLFQSENSEVSASVSQDGSFTVELENGAYQVKHDDLIHTGGPVVIADAPLDGVEIRLVPGARLQGRILGLPPEQSSLSISAKSFHPKRSTGRFFPLMIPM